MYHSISKDIDEIDLDINIDIDIDIDMGFPR